MDKLKKELRKVKRLETKIMVMQTVELEKIERLKGIGKRILKIFDGKPKKWRDQLDRLEEPITDLRKALKDK